MANRTLAEDGACLRAVAMANPCARAPETTRTIHQLAFVSRGRRWSAILTVNR